MFRNVWVCPNADTREMLKINSSQTPIRRIKLIVISTPVHIPRNMRNFQLNETEFYRNTHAHGHQRMNDEWRLDYREKATGTVARWTYRYVIWRFESYCSTIFVDHITASCHQPNISILLFLCDNIWEIAIENGGH